MTRPSVSLNAERRRPLRVLVIEDDPSVLPFLRLALSRLGHSSVTAPDCACALAAAADPTAEIDAVLTDIQLPDGDGGRLARQIRASRPGVGVILMSGSPGALAEARGAEPDLAVVEKPFGVTELETALQTAVAGNRP